MAAAPPPSAWQAPPAFFADSLVLHLAACDSQLLSWGARIGALRALSRGWRDAVGDALPLLHLKAGTPVAEVAAIVRHFPGLRLLHCGRPAFGAMSETAQAEAAAAALSAVCASCPDLQHLRFARCPHVHAAALQPIPALRRLRCVSLRVAGSGPMDPSFAQQLPDLRRLSIATPHTCVAPGLSALVHLTFLHLEGRQLPAGVCTELALLTGLRHLGLAGGGLAASSAQHLAALPRLSSISLNELLEAEEPPPDSKPAELLAALLAASRSGAHAPQLRRVKLLTYSETTPLDLSALSGLESLHVRHAQLQYAPAAQVTCLSRLTELTVHLTLSEGMIEEEEAIGFFVGTIGRRLTRLRRLRLWDCLEVPEQALEQLSGLTALTELSLESAFDFGGRVLEALRPLASLRRLLLSRISLTPPALHELLAASTGEGSDGDGVDEEPRLLPGLTSLELHYAQLLEPPDVVQLACALPALRHLTLSGWPRLQQQHLGQILEACPGISLLTTDWKPPPAGPPGTAPEAERRREQGHGGTAFTRKWWPRLQYSIEFPAQQPDLGDDEAFDAAAALAEVVPGIMGAADADA